MTDATPQHEPPSKAARVLARFGPIVFPLLIVLGVAAAIWQSCNTKSTSRASAEAFLADLREGRLRAAYERLTPEARATIPFDRFTARTDEPVLREGGEVSLDSESKSWESGRRVCVPGSITRPDGAWGVELYLVRGDNDGYLVQAWAVDPPRAMQQLHLIDACR